EGFRGLHAGALQARALMREHSRVRDQTRVAGSVFALRPARRAKMRAAKRTTFGSSQITNARNSTSNTRNTSGCEIARKRPPRTSPSSPNLAVQLLSGSGEVLMTARLPLLARCVPP